MKQRITDIEITKIDFGDYCGSAWVDAGVLGGIITDDVSKFFFHACEFIEEQCIDADTKFARVGEVRYAPCQELAV